MDTRTVTAGGAGQGGIEPIPDAGELWPQCATWGLPNHIILKRNRTIILNTNKITEAIKILGGIHSLIF